MKTALKILSLLCLTMSSASSTEDTGLPKTLLFHTHSTANSSTLHDHRVELITSVRRAYTLAKLEQTVTENPDFFMLNDGRIVADLPPILITLKY